MYQKVDLTKRGGVYVKETSEYSFLTRASLNVQEEFHDPSFRANSVVVVTCDDVIEFNETDSSVIGSALFFIINVYKLYFREATLSKLY